MGTYRIFIVLILFTFLANNCTKGEKIPVVEFTIQVALTHKASNKLKQSGETIKGTIFFDGDGESLAGIKTAPHRDVILGSYNFELKEEGTITIGNAFISKEAYLRLSEKNYHYFINITSGRHIFKNNILNGGYADGRLQDLETKKSIEIVCDLL